MHITDGILNAPMMAGTGALAATGVVLGLRKMDHDHVPRVAMVSAVYFMASLIRFPVGPVSTHLVLTGLIGLLLGWAAFPAIASALLLQTVLFGFGGLTSWGANVLITALPAVLCWYAFGPGIRRAPSARRAFLLAFVAGATGLLGSGLMLAGSLYLCGSEFLGAGTAILVSHLPVIVVEGIVTGGVASFLHRVHPGMLQG